MIYPRTGWWKSLRSRSEGVDPVSLGTEKDKSAGEFLLPSRVTPDLPLPPSPRPRAHPGDYDTVARRHRLRERRETREATGKRVHAERHVTFEPPLRLPERREPRKHTEHRPYQRGYVQL